MFLLRSRLRPRESRPGPLRTGYFFTHADHAILECRKDFQPMFLAGQGLTGAAGSRQPNILCSEPDARTVPCLSSAVTSALCRGYGCSRNVLVWGCAMLRAVAMRGKYGFTERQERCLALLDQLSNYEVDLFIAVLERAVFAPATPPAPAAVQALLPGGHLATGLEEQEREDGVS